MPTAPTSVYTGNAPVYRFKALRKQLERLEIGKGFFLYYLNNYCATSLLRNKGCKFMGNYNFINKKFHSDEIDKMREKLKDLNNPALIEMFENCVKDVELLCNGLAFLYKEEESEKNRVLEEYSKFRACQIRGSILKEKDIEYIINKKKENFSNRAIAKDLSVSEGTIRNALKKINISE